MHVYGTVDVNLTHLPFGPTFSAVRFEKKRYKCPVCGRTEMEYVIFQVDGHRITIPLLNFTIGLLELGLPLKTISGLTGLGKNTVKDINKKRLEEIFTELDAYGKRSLKKPEAQAKHLGIDESKMAESIIEIIDTCNATKNDHFNWFANLLENHFEGIIAHASLTFFSGKVEGINNLIKTIRRTGYGYPDDDYFFLKIIDQSRKTYVRNEKSHRKCD